MTSEIIKEYLLPICWEKQFQTVKHKTNVVTIAFELKTLLCIYEFISLQIIKCFKAPPQLWNRQCFKFHFVPGYFLIQFGSRHFVMFSTDCKQLRLQDVVFIGVTFSLKISSAPAGDWWMYVSFFFDAVWEITSAVPQKHKQVKEPIKFSCSCHCG